MTWNRIIYRTNKSTLCTSMKNSTDFFIRIGVYGFIFLFKWSKESVDSKEIAEKFTDDPTVFFAQQVQNV